MYYCVDISIQGFLSFKSNIVYTYITCIQVYFNKNKQIYVLSIT